ncbi:CDC48 family AAA ATPase [Euryarchaeota archaeon]|jgi:transitional endoplasmic reticulum ATPase|uniref:Cell division cycle protein 48, AAA family ATPase n=1 Tax=uncultured Poseidoniia archaeon TaxID=1697135 RepID=A0A0R7K418_9ARCH|nr:cell division cycle protein 48, AAA family ATPase [uncultured Candidatus Thalassoarchaea sp.]MDA7603273.1 CDC48 family AAA ATPase [Euryarchaeota archaeon]MDC0047636.1 CDC48 family AAA ATPase [Euryarchaeota archaeon]MDC0555495.1 CDC48 family AAA ATPase [Euryarchaeota archaeon]RCH72698.1 MAG: AAA family ATPase [Candidatus Poseidoniales archaeon]|tara:strand:+ start:7575 stop:9806 length:2232 start_codon:yes stop_codon:yes gene_type:complete
MSNEEVDDLQLRVAKAIPSDVGHGRARVPFDNDLNLKPGDIVEITGEQKTAAIVWRCRPEDANLGIIRVDGIIRKNAGVSLGDKVSIRKVETQPCQKLILSPVMAKQQKVRFGPGIEGFARRGLNKRPVVSGDRIFIPGMTLFAEALPFQIVQTTPKGIVQVLPDTEIIIKEEPVDEEDESGQPISTISYEDIGGIGEQLQKVREMIELPLKHPILFRRLGIDPPRGVLLHGPPGTGKTLIAKAVASETKANFTSINGPEIISKYYGESEKQLREIFDEAAANSPAIIFIDELDSIAPKREDVSGEVERRVVAQLLTLLDGMQGRDNVIVIGATNRPDAIDPALRRGGRFDRELEIGVPDKNGRAEIIGIHTRGMPISDDFEIDWLLDNTHGFVGADISALVREAAMKALRRYLPEIDLDEEQIPAEVLEKMEVRMSDFKLAIKEIEPSALREIFLEVPEVSWDQVGGLKEVKERLKESIEWPLTKPEMFEHFGINPPRGIVLFGAPGTGKTLIAKAIANEAKANFITIKGPELISKWVGDSEKAVRELFKKAKQSSPSIIFLDEFESIAGVRRSNTGEGSDVMNRVVNQLLSSMDGVESMEGVIVVAATNRPEMIDPALLRSGRFERVLHIPPPDVDSIRAILKIHSEPMPLGKFKIEDLAPQLINYTGADIEAICREAALISMRAEKKSVSKKHFEEAINRVRPTITDEMMDYYNRMEGRLTSGLESVRRNSEVHSGIESA